MSLSPLNINVLGQFLQNTGLYINPNSQAVMGTSTGPDNYLEGLLMTQSGLQYLMQAINESYVKLGTDATLNVSQSVYNDLIKIGSTTIPMLGLSVPSTYTTSLTSEQMQYGFPRIIAQQAHDEFYLNNGSYKDFIHTFIACQAASKHMNSAIQDCTNASSYLLGSYSNMNDLITGDITGVSMATLAWGTDLISSGRAIDLTNITNFGNPDVLLRTIFVNNAMSNALNLALIGTGISTTDLLAICKGQQATYTQQRLIYAAFNLIVEKDLSDILVPLNVQLNGLLTLADLLDPKKLFPNSYQTLTYPQYNTTLNGPTNSKTYYLIYKNNQVNYIPDFKLEANLITFLPQDLAFSCGAFSYAMGQIKNISTMDIEKFSQVVTNLEPVSDLTSVTSTNVPTDLNASQAALSSMANGSNSDGTFSIYDYFGAMTSSHYDWGTMLTSVNNIMSIGLPVIYQNMFNLVNGDGPYNTELETLIASANAEIASIQTNNSTLATTINNLYLKFGTQLQIEQNARKEVLGDTTLLAGTSSDIINFLNNIGTYSQDTQTNGIAPFLEEIADTTTLGGGSLIASMREARNALKLSLTGAVQDNNISDNNLSLPTVTGTMSTLGVPIVTGAPIVPGSLAGSSQINLIPSNLSIFNTPNNTKAVISPAAAINQVITCNCDCWIQD